MATVFESISLKGLRKTHLAQLLFYLEEHERGGCYYGHRGQFEKRHIELRAWLKDAVEYAYSDSVILPK